PRGTSGERSVAGSEATQGEHAEEVAHSSSRGVRSDVLSTELLYQMDRVLRARERGDRYIGDLRQTRQQPGEVVACDVTLDVLENHPRYRLGRQARQFLGLRSIAVAFLEEDREGSRDLLRAADRGRTGRVALDEPQVRDRGVGGDQPEQRVQAVPNSLGPILDREVGGGARVDDVLGGVLLGLQ